jgi:uncharacterized protein (DUF111 family)
MILALDGKGGIAGNLWLSVMLGMGAGVNKLFSLPDQLGLEIGVYCEYKQEPEHKKTTVCLAFPGTEHAEEVSYQEMQERIQSTGLPSALRNYALQIFEKKQRAEEFRMGPLESQRFSGDEMADTLIDIVGGVTLWEDLGSPKVTLENPLAIGVRCPASDILLQSIPCEKPTGDMVFATPTGAALLQAFYSTETTPQTEKNWQVTAEGAYSQAGKLPALQATLYLH